MSDNSRSDDDVSVDAVLDVLSHERRRLVLEYLLQHGNSATVEELVDYLVAVARPGINARPSELRSRVYGRLHHVHLPKMDDAGIVEYDRDRSVVSVTNATPVVRLYLEFFGGDDSE